MKKVERSKLRVLIWNHFEKGADRRRLMDEIVAFIETHYTDIELTNNQALHQLINEIKDSGGLELWKKRLAYMIRKHEI